MKQSRFTPLRLSVLLELRYKCGNSMDDGTAAHELYVGDYRITPFGEEGDFWIGHKGGEGMQVFKVNFERLIDEFYKNEF